MNAPRLDADSASWSAYLRVSRAPLSHHEWAEHARSSDDLDCGVLADLELLGMSGSHAAGFHLRSLAPLFPGYCSCNPQRQHTGSSEEMTVFGSITATGDKGVCLERPLVTALPMDTLPIRGCVAGLQHRILQFSSDLYVVAASFPSDAADTSCLTS